MRRLFILFFVSGFPALLYQIVWQRALFAIYGINVESVTVVVSAFMLGLGLGSLGGGWLSARHGVRRLLTFGAIELLIGLFGLVSLPIFDALGRATAGAPPLAAGVFAFVLVLVPTTLMGATLPLLTAHLVDRSGNVGRSVGGLYFANTLGSAVACFAAGLVLLGALGQTGTVRLAAALNLALGVGVLLYARRERGAAAAPPVSVRVRGALPFGLALLLSACAGFIALSHEILWFRLFAFTSGGAARAFALLLGAYLAGLAFGALASRRLCRGEAGADGRRLLATVGWSVVAANLVALAVAPTLGWLVTQVYHYAAGLVLVVLAAGALGAVFPLLSHLAIPPTHRAGQGLGQLYLANIVGASLGSVLTGFVLMAHFGVAAITTGLTVAGLGGGALLLAGAGAPARRRALVPAVLGALLVFAGPPFFDGLYERLHYKTAYAGQRYARLVETQSGVVAVTQDGLVYGGGIYDGEFKTRFDTLADDSNMLFRTYMLFALRPAPRRVLVIGLGSGSWAKILASHPAVERLTIIEIDPGYLEIVRAAPEVRSLLDDPKVEIVIDDGRRWLIANPEARFDAIVSNTTFNWRAHASGLLGREFLALCRRHLAPEGVLYYNTTWHPRVERTGAAAFEHAVRIGNFLAVSEAPLEPDPSALAEVLEGYTVAGRPAVGPRGIEALVELAGSMDDPARLDTRHAIESRASILERTEGRALITDDNMGTEWDWRRIDTVQRTPHP